MRQNHIKTQIFDFNSIMMYGSVCDEAAIDPSIPIMQTRNNQPWEAQREYLSANDIDIVERLYSNSPETGYFTDTRDRNEYRWVIIGEQTWMAENLAYLPSITPGIIGSTTDPHYYVLGYWGSDLETAKATSEYQTFGALYNFPAAIESYPSGWHQPTDQEWTELSDYLGGENIAGDKMKEVGIEDWTGNSTNEIGFSALPAGIRSELGGFGLADILGCGHLLRMEQTKHSDWSIL